MKEIILLLVCLSALDITIHKNMFCWGRWVIKDQHKCIGFVISSINVSFLSLWLLTFIELTYSVNIWVYLNLFFWMTLTLRRTVSGPEPVLSAAEGQVSLCRPGERGVSRHLLTVSRSVNVTSIWPLTATYNLSVESQSRYRKLTECIF